MPDKNQPPEAQAFFFFANPGPARYDPEHEQAQAQRRSDARQRYGAAPPPGKEDQEAAAKAPAAPTKEGPAAGPPPSAAPDETAAGAAAGRPGPVPTVQAITVRQYAFLDALPRNVLDSYLLRAVQMEGMCTEYPAFAGSTGQRLNNPADPAQRQAMQAVLDTVLAAEADFVRDVGAKFLGRVAGWWGQWGAEHELARLVQTADYLHARDPELVLQACVFEYVDRGIEAYPDDDVRQPAPTGVGARVPQWAWDEFYPGQPYRSTFDVFPASPARPGMVFVDPGTGQPLNPVGGGYCPDITKTETQMWVYWRAVRYLDAGCEAIHFGQANLIGSADPSNEAWWGVLGRIRDYAAGRKGRYHDNILGRDLRQWDTPLGKRGARRGVVLCDAHTHGLLRYRPGTAREYQLLFDFHSSPLRPADSVRGTNSAILAPDTELRAGFGGSPGGAIYGRSAWGYAPIAPYELHTSAPFLAEFDNVGRTDQVLPIPGGLPWVRSYDEISWFGGGQAPEGAVFARQPPLAPGTWTLRYAVVTGSNELLPNAPKPGTGTMYRDWYLRYFWQEVRRLDENGWFLVPGRRGVVLMVLENPPLTSFNSQYPQGIGYCYRAYDATPALAALNLPSGYGGQQATIRALFEERGARWEYDALRPDPNDPYQSLTWANVASDLFTDATGKTFYRGVDNRLWLFYRTFAGPEQWEWLQVAVDDVATGPHDDVGGGVAFDEPRRRIYYLSTDPDPDIRFVEYDDTGWHYRDTGSLVRLNGWPPEYAPHGPATARQHRQGALHRSGRAHLLGLRGSRRVATHRSELASPAGGRWPGSLAYRALVLPRARPAHAQPALRVLTTGRSPALSGHNQPFRAVPKLVRIRTSVPRFCYGR